MPADTTIKITGQTIRVTGPKGELAQDFPKHFIIDNSKDQLRFSVQNPKDIQQKADWGTFAALIKNMVNGVSTGFTKQLEIQGVGYTWTVSGQKLNIKVGFSHPVEFDLPKGVEAKIAKNILTLTGFDKQLLGNIAAQIRGCKPPEPYKGKGIRYVGEHVRKKAGKQAGTSDAK